MTTTSKEVLRRQRRLEIGSLQVPGPVHGKCRRNTSVNIRTGPDQA